MVEFKYLVACAACVYMGAMAERSRWNRLIAKGVLPRPTDKWRVVGKYERRVKQVVDVVE